MRIAYIGNFEPEFSTENDVRKAFEYLGHEVVRLQENVVSLPVVHGEALKSDMLLITSSWDSALPLRDMMTTFYRCAESGIPTVTLHLDTFWGKSRGGRAWWRNSMFHTAYIFTADGDYQDQWKLFGRNHIWLPPAVRHDALGSGQFRAEYACDVAFVGSNGEGYHEDIWPYRKDLVNKLREICARNNLSFKNIGGDLPKVERSKDMNDFYASAKVTVGDSLCLKKEDSHYWSDRVPEATGRRGFLIMPQIDELERHWPELPMYDWGDWQHLEETILYWLANKTEREVIKESLWKRTVKYGTYVNRVETILDTVGLSND
jgi:hypothetical protein